MSATHEREYEYRCSCGAQWGTSPFDKAGGKSWSDWWEHHVAEVGE